MTLPQPTIRPLFRFFGSKWTLAVKYPEPLYPVIVEPFAGGAGYSTRYYDRQVILIEKDPKIAAIWRWLIDARPDEIRDIPLLNPGDIIPESWPDPVRWFVGFWASMTPARPLRKMNPSCGKVPGNAWCEKVRERTSLAVERIRHWILIEGDYSTLGNCEATWYIDPPYVPPTSGKKTDMYAQGSRAIDYAALAEWCATREGQVIVCENEGADWLPFRPFVRGHSTPRHSAGSPGTAESIYYQIAGVDCTP